MLDINFSKVSVLEKKIFSRRKWKAIGLSNIFLEKIGAMLKKTKKNRALSFNECSTKIYHWGKSTSYLSVKSYWCNNKDKWNKFRNLLQMNVLSADLVTWLYYPYIKQ